LVTDLHQRVDTVVDQIVRDTPVVTNHVRTSLHNVAVASASIATASAYGSASASLAAASAYGSASASIATASAYGSASASLAAASGSFAAGSSALLY
jgi:hypothetical protein